MLNHEFMLITAIVINATLAVLHGSPRSLVLASALFVIIIYVYKTYGSLYEESRVTWESWKRGGRTSPWFRRYCRAHRPARILMGSFFYADKGLALTIFSIVLDNTANMILTTRGN